LLALTAGRDAFASYTAELVLVIAGAVVLSGLGHGVWFAFRTLRKRAANQPAEIPRRERQIPERVTQELLKCLALGDCVERDASVLASSLAAPTASIDGTVPRAAHQLLKTAGALARRLRRVAERTQRGGAGKQATSAESAILDDAFGSQQSDLELRDYSKLQSLGRRAEKSARGFGDARKFPRTPCDGIANATIYPSPNSLTKEHVQCVVDMRSISRGGISFGHDERLYPQQIVVIEVAGKLLVGEIRWCKKDHRGYIAGCKLVKASG
jgi:hypothetical protein